MKTEHFNGLSESEAERLALLIEECAEVQQIACKILRHGYESYHPTDKNRVTNRDLLAVELGDVMAAVEMLEEDVSCVEIQKAQLCKLETVTRYLHHHKP